MTISAKRDHRAEIQKAFKDAAEKTGVPVKLLKMVAAIESSNQPNVESPTGAQGIMQIMPKTKDHIVKNLAPRGAFPARGIGWDTGNVNTNVLLGAYYLKDILNKFDDDWERSMAAYNIGPNNRWIKSENWKENKRYSQARGGSENYSVKTYIDRANKIAQDRSETDKSWNDIPMSSMIAGAPPTAAPKPELADSSGVGEVTPPQTPPKWDIKPTHEAGPINIPAGEPSGGDRLRELRDQVAKQRRGEQEKSWQRPALEEGDVGYEQARMGQEIQEYWRDYKPQSGINPATGQPYPMLSATERVKLFHPETREQELKRQSEKMLRTTQGIPGYPRKAGETVDYPIKEMDEFGATRTFRTDPLRQIQDRLEGRDYMDKPPTPVVSEYVRGRGPYSTPQDTPYGVPSEPSYQVDPDMKRGTGWEHPTFKQNIADTAERYAEGVETELPWQQPPLEMGSQQPAGTQAGLPAAPPLPSLQEFAQQEGYNPNQSWDQRFRENYAETNGFPEQESPMETVAQTVTDTAKSMDTAPGNKGQRDLLVDVASRMGIDLLPRGGSNEKKHVDFSSVTGSDDPKKQSWLRKAWETGEKYLEPIAEYGKYIPGPQQPFLAGIDVAYDVEDALTAANRGDYAGAVMEGIGAYGGAKGLKGGEFSQDPLNAYNVVGDQAESSNLMKGIGKTAGKVAAAGVGKALTGGYGGGSGTSGSPYMDQADSAAQRYRQQATRTNQDYMRLTGGRLSAQGIQGPTRQGIIGSQAANLTASNQQNISNLYNQAAYREQMANMMRDQEDKRNWMGLLNNLSQIYSISKMDLEDDTETTTEDPMAGFNEKILAELGE